jgi:hypothetical protein
MGGYVELLKRHSAEVGKLEGAAADGFLSLLKDLQDRVRGRLANVGPSDSALDVFAMRRALAEAEQAISTMGYTLVGGWTKEAQKAAELAAEHAGAELDAASRTFAGKPLRVSVDAARVVADPDQPLLAEQFAGTVEKYGTDLLQGVRRELFIGIRGGQTLGQATKNIAGESGVFGRVGRANGERLIRTETSNAYNVANQTAQKEIAKAVPVKKIWLHVGSYPCPVCMPLHGTTRPIDGTWTAKVGKKTRTVAHPPLHPHCVCRTSVVTKAMEKAASKLSFLKPQDDDEDE